MSCELAVTTLHGYFDGELDAVRAAEFERHMGSCAQCQGALVALRSLREGLKKADLYQPASSRLRSQIAQKLPRESRDRPGWKWFLVPAFSVIAAVVVFWGGVLWFQPRTYSARIQTELIDAHVRSLQAGHLTDVESTDQHTVKPWFDGKLDFIPPVSDFSQQGFPLVGGRLDVLGGHTVAALVYGRRKHLINVFVWPVRSGDAGVIGSGARQGYNWLGWRAGDMQFYLVSDASADDLRELKELIRP